MIGLKGSVINHTYLMWNRSLAFNILAMLALFVAYFITNSPEVLIFVQAFFIITVPLGVLESTQISFVNNWNTFERSFAISPKFLILSRYIMFICASLLCAIIWRISPFHGLHETEILFDFFILTTQLMGIIYLPVMYLLNPNKKNSATIILLGVMFGAGALSFFLTVQAQCVLCVLCCNPWATAAIIAGLYVISATLSIFFDNIHRGRAN